MAKKNDSLGDRMKGYEGVSRNFLTRRVPAIIRLDGKAFHTFTKGMEKPFDPVLTQAMQETMKYLCENIQGCVLGYTQSDEITLVLTDYALSRPTPGLDITFRKCAAFRRRWQLWHLTGSLNVSLRIGFTTMARIGNLSVSMLTSILPYINGTMPTKKRCSLPCSTPAFSLSQKKRSVTV